MMLGTSLHWMGNRVHLEAIDDTDLVILTWCRPYNGAFRGVRVIDRDELDLVNTAREQAENGTREHPRFEDLAGRPLDLEAFLGEVVER